MYAVSTHRFGGGLTLTALERNQDRSDDRPLEARDSFETRTDDRPGTNRSPLHEVRTQLLQLSSEPVSCANSTAELVFGHSYDEGFIDLPEVVLGNPLPRAVGVRVTEDEFGG